MFLYLSISLVFFSAGFLQGVSGFGAALLAMPLLVLVLDVKEAVTLTLLNTIILNLFLSVHLKSHIDWRKILPLVIGCVPGVYVGVTILKNVNPAIVKCSLGILIISYGLYSLLGRVRQRSISKGWGYVAGFATGTISGAFSAGGPPTIIYTTLTGWKRDEIKATLSSFFFFTSALSATGHFLNGLTTSHVWRLWGITALPVLAGVFLGALFCKRLKTKSYLTIIYYLLIVLGIMMVVSGLK
ncbi:MAG: sulfite exporter TauE/SafE family protein [Proteobacteria bacterium]|nr:sulfite exporter TauE/SafE family protein [Pseudomonadota bacterium]MBU1640727.1 sulfite exporter TauE/SafE family protein [Pseudomonadota bacterium]